MIKASKLNIARLSWQRKTLLDIVKEYKFNPNAHLKDSLIEYTLYKIRRYALAHFKREEDFMHKINYPRKEAHFREHQGLLNTLNDLISRIRNKSLVLSIEISAFLDSWVNHHSEIMDEHVMKYIKTKIELCNLNNNSN